MTNAATPLTDNFTKACEILKTKGLEEQNYEVDNAKAFSLQGYFNTVRVLVDAENVQVQKRKNNTWENNGHSSAIDWFAESGARVNIGSYFGGESLLNRSNETCYARTWAL